MDIEYRFKRQKFTISSSLKSKLTYKIWRDFLAFFFKNDATNCKDKLMNDKNIVKGMFIALIALSFAVIGQRYPVGELSVSASSSPHSRKSRSGR